MRASTPCIGIAAALVSAVVVGAGCGSIPDSRSYVSADASASGGSGGMATGGSSGTETGGVTQVVTGGAGPGGSPTGGASGAGGAGGIAGTGGTSSTDLDQILHQFAEIICRRQEECAPGSLHWLFGNYDSCVSVLSALNVWEAALPGNTWDIPDSTACNQAWEAAPCSQIFNPVDPPVCQLPGSHALGQPCNDNSECTSIFCKQTGYSCGVCASPPPAGSTCAEDWDCAPGFWCMPSGTCQAPSKLGEPCSDNQYCRNDLVCSGGTCVTPPNTAGSACDSSSGLYCDWTLDLTCSSSSCTPFPPRAAGQTCTSAVYCEGLGSCVNGVCQASAGPGEHCDPASRVFCAIPGRCVAGICETPTTASRCPGP